MGKNIRTIVLIVIGIISVGLSIRCFSYKALDSTPMAMYGGDAYTGIQNAGAQTAENIKDLASIVQFGFGSILFIAGLGFLCVGLTTPISRSNQGYEEESSMETDNANIAEDETAKEIVEDAKS